MKFSLIGITLFFVLFCGVAFIFFVNPESSVYPPCLFKKLTGLQCPGCGSARACYHLLHGHIFTAIDYNLLFTCLMPLLCFEVLARVLPVRTNWQARLRIIENHVQARHLLVVVMLFWVARNLPIFPLSFLSSDL